MEFFKKVPAFPFMRLRKGWYALSALLVVVSIGSLFVRGLNFGVDFTGGVTIQATFPQSPDLNAIRAGIEGLGYAEPQVQNFGSSRDVAIRLPPNDKQSGADIRAKVEAVLRKIDAAAEIRGVEVVGPQVGGELQRSAIMALGFTLLLIAMYVGLRFHTWRLSFGAIIAAIHDPLLVVGFFSITQMTFDLAVVAAILAVIGYSLNDTVVVFDRIRERFEANRRAKPEEVLDRSINETLSRTIMTSFSTAIVVVVLLILGGPALQGFSSALLVGILVGTYSSIYIASAVALDFGLRWDHLFPQTKKTAIDDMP